MKVFVHVLALVAALPIAIQALALEDDDQPDVRYYDEYTAHRRESTGRRARDVAVEARDSSDDLQCALIIDEDGNSSTSYFPTTTVSKTTTTTKTKDGTTTKTTTKTSTTKTSTTTTTKTTSTTTKTSSTSTSKSSTKKSSIKTTSKSSTKTTSKTSTTTSSTVITAGAAIHLSSGTYITDFVTKSGNKLILNGETFRFASLNVPGLLMTEDRNDGFTIPSPREQLDAIRTIANMNGRVIRTYTLAVGSGYHINSKGVYNEDAFVAMDYAISTASKYGIRLIIPLINNWGGSSAYGDYNAFAKIWGGTGNNFFTSSSVISGFKGFVKTVLTRKNTISGIVYGEDPTILAWQLGNELGGWSDAPPVSWTTTMVTYMRSYTSSLIMDGSFGGLTASSKWTKSMLSDDNSPDIFDQHYYYGSSDIARIKSDSALLAKYDKAFIIGEFGLSSTSVYTSVYKAAYENEDVAGALIWSLRFHSIYGGIYVHSEKTNSAGKTYWAYHAPGFPSTSSWNYNPVDNETVVINTVRTYAAKMAKSVVWEPIPDAPHIISATHGKVIWMGSSFGYNYTIERKGSSEDDSAYVELASGITVNVKFGEFIYKDTKASSSKTYYYRIWAVGPGGKSPTGTVAGPI